MRGALLALGTLLVVGAGVAPAQIPNAVYRNLGRPAYSCYEEEPIHRWWLGSEYLLWWTRGQQFAIPVILGDTGGVFPTGEVNYGKFSGVRATAGSWWSCERNFGGEASGFILFKRGQERRPTNIGAISLNTPDGNPTPVNSATIITNSQLWGGEGNILLNWGRRCGWELDFYYGVRYLDLTEDLTINATTVADIATSDMYYTRNQFYGAQFGSKLGWYPGRCSFELIGKVALGNSHQVVRIDGQNTAGGGGAFATGASLGRRTHDEFAVVPEIQVKFGFELFPNVHVGAGYNFLYWNHVVRPGLQISNSGAALINDSDYYAHGLNVSLEYKY